MVAPSTTFDALLRIEIPGIPVGQGRARAVRRKGKGGTEYIAMLDPERSVEWKSRASYFMQKAARLKGINALWSRPLTVTVVAYFPRPLRLLNEPSVVWRPSLPDADNLGKAALDAGNGVLWADDAQVVRLVVEKRYAAEGRDPHVSVEIGEAP